ncbi:hypothetical protein F4809DRAFT_641696 [Biscogniauxia mediterranea]|nr:hypothetical protein F4809DRAFT_641696 [Biscogniauxia mediterranea]
MAVILPAARPAVALQPSHKSALAMSRAQFLAAHHAQNHSSGGGRARPPADRLFVGVCILRAGSGSESEREKRETSTTDGPAGKREKKYYTIIPPPPLLRRMPTRLYSPPSSSPSSSSSSSSSPEGGEALLLLRRRCRRRRHHYPGCKNAPGGGDSGWELPGGEVGEDDFCVSAAAARLVGEQTGLRVAKITGALGETRYVRRSGSRKSITGKGGGGSRRGEGVLLWWDDDEEEDDDGQLARECLQLNFTALVEDPDKAVLRSGDHDAMAWTDLGSARMALAAGPTLSSSSLGDEEEVYFF